MDEVLRSIIGQWLNSSGQTPDTNVGLGTLGQMAGYLGPTGRVYPQDDGGYSTEISGVSEHPTQPGKYTFAPSLVPGQVGISSLLRTMRPDWMQNAFAQDWAKENAGQLPAYGSIDEALAHEQWRHTLLEMGARGRGPLPSQGYGLLPNWRVTPSYR